MLRFLKSRLGRQSRRFPEGFFSEYLPAFNRETFVAALQDGYVNPATHELYAPLRLWTLKRRQAAWTTAGHSREAAKTIGKHFNALLAMYWALTHVEDLQEKFGLDYTAGAKHLEKAGGQMMTALGSPGSSWCQNTRLTWRGRVRLRLCD